MKKAGKSRTQIKNKQSFIYYNNHIYIGKLTDSSRLEGERKSLVDYVKSCSSKYGEGFAVQLGYVDAFLHSNSSILKEMLDHAESLKHAPSVTDKPNIETHAVNMTERELALVLAYMHALCTYVTGGPFEPVYKAAEELVRLKPLPPNYYADSESSEGLVRALLLV